MALLLALPLGACAGGAGGTGLKVGLALDPIGAADLAFNKLVSIGVAAAQARLGGRIAQVRTFTATPGENEQDKYQRLIILCESGYGLVIAVGSGYAGPDPAHGPLARATADCPTTRFALVDDASVTAPNLANLAFAEDQGAYLMGAAAALRAGSGQPGRADPGAPGAGTGAVAMLAGCRSPAMAGVEAGYRAGAAAARPVTRVEVEYPATEPVTCASGKADFEAARAAAARLYATGAGVVYELTGQAAAGVLAAAKAANGLVIGSGTDAYLQYGALLRGSVLTSLLKRADLVLDQFVGDVVAGRFSAGTHLSTLKSGMLGYAASGGYIADLAPRLDIYKQEIIDGKVIFPNQP